jgi:hypothetical protein
MKTVNSLDCNYWNFEEMSMKTVTKDEFFAAVGKLDVHPCPQRMKTLWKLRNGKIVGVSTPGWKCVGEKTWSILDPQ